MSSEAFLLSLRMSFLVFHAFSFLVTVYSINEKRLFQLYPEETLQYISAIESTQRPHSILI